MTPSECEDCEYDNDCDNQCSECFAHLVCVQTPPPLRKNRFFSEGRGRSVHRLLQMSCDKYPVRSNSLKKNLAVKGRRKVHKIKSSTIESDKALFCPGILLCCTGKHQSQ